MKKRRALAVLCGLLAALIIFPGVANAAITYMPDVTQEMTKARYWSEKMGDPDELIADYDQIQYINQLIVEGSGTNVQDISTWQEGTFDGVSFVARVKKASEEGDVPYLYNMGARFADDGTKYTSLDDALKYKYMPMIENMTDPDATDSMPYQFAICTTRTCLNTFPSDEQLRDDFKDPDFDYQPLAALRVNEPVVLRTKSADGKYYYAITNAVSGWVPVEDIAICQDREEWLDAWYTDDPDEYLVVTNDRIFTDESNYAPEVSKRELTLGTTLKLADQSEWTERIINRSPHNNLVVWMPVRNDDGTYRKELALIAEHNKTQGKVNEGFLPLTWQNLSRVALSQLGTVYGWSGMLGSNDCSGYVRDVYRCFGFELARNTNWQMAEPVKQYDLSGMSDAEKTELIKTLPLGTVLFFSGHEMIYLGHEGDLLYVMSSVSSAYVEGKFTRIRSGVINTLDLTRGNGRTWLSNLIKANIPYLTPDQDLPVIPEPEEEPEPEPGDVETDVTAKGIEADALGLDEIAGGLLTEEDQAQIENGAQAKIWMEFQALDQKDVPGKDLTVLKQYLSENDLTAATYMDISLYKQVGDNEKEAVHDSMAPVYLSIHIPEELMTTDENVSRTFFLLRAHDGVADEIAGDTGEYLEGESQYFSTYLLAYQDVTETPGEKDGEDDKNTPAPADDSKPGPSEQSDSGISGADNAQNDGASQSRVADNTKKSVPSGKAEQKKTGISKKVGKWINSADSGDDNAVIVWSVIGAAALAGIIGTGVARKRKGK